MPPLPASFAPNAVGRERLSREEMVERQRDVILDGAIAVFARRGYKAGTVGNIVAAAKSSGGTFYSHFANREECFLAAYERTVRRARERIVMTLPRGGSQPARILAALAALLQLMAEDRLAARLVLIEAQTAGERALAAWEASLDGLVPELRRLRRASPFAAELPESVEITTLGGAVWYLQQRVLHGESGDPEALLPELAEIVLGPYLGPEETVALLAHRAT